MLIRRRAYALFLLPALAACTMPDVSLETDAEKASYAIGRNIGSSLVEIKDHIEVAAVFRGISDVLAEIDAPLSDNEMQAALTAFQTTVTEALTAVQSEEAATAMAEGEAFLAENAGKEGVMTTASGLQYEVLREGDGATPGRDQRVVLHYRGTLIDGTEFDTSYGGEPANFSAGGLITGFTDALMLMKVGGHWRVFIPSELAYGEAGSGSIGPNQVLIFEIELLGIE